MGYLVPILGMELYLENTHKDSGSPNILERVSVVVRSLVPRGGGTTAERPQLKVLQKQRS